MRHEYYQSIELLQRASKILMETGDRFGLVRALENLASTLIEIGERRSAVDTLRRAISIAEEIRYPAKDDLSNRLAQLTESEVSDKEAYEQV
jgi:tetratricopeptide (TPR) repeat protein